jgi:hypothetical protein
LRSKPSSSEELPSEPQGPQIPEYHLDEEAEIPDWLADFTSDELEGEPEGKPEGETGTPDWQKGEEFPAITEKPGEEFQPVSEEPPV